MNPGPSTSSTKEPSIALLTTDTNGNPVGILNPKDGSTILLGIQTSSTGSAVIPSGTTAQRDVSPVAGYERYNTTLGSLEYYGGATWEQIVDAPMLNAGTLPASFTALTAGDASLQAISKSIHFGAIVKNIIYDTSKDSDGGAWRKRCTDKSWYTETIVTGQWRSQQANLAAAWAITGAAVGDFYQNTTDGKYYTITGTIGAQTQTEIFRGNVREFPEQVAIVAESGRVVIYDLTQVGCPMWMVFLKIAGTFASSIVMLGRSGAAVTGLASINGQIVVTATGGAESVVVLNFIADNAKNYTSGISYDIPTTIASRNVLTTWIVSSRSILVNYNINDVAITVLDNAPIDPSTQLPVPTIAVATAGGLSTITNSGTVVNSTSTVAVNKCEVDGKKLTTVRSDGVVSVWNDITTMAVTPDTTYSASTIPAMLGTAGYTGKKIQIGSTLGLTLVKDNPTTPANGMVAAITNTYNSGWMIGNIQAAFCADAAATITDRSVKALASTSTTIVTAPVASGAGLRSFKDTGGNITATLGATIANGHHVHWELVSSVWHQYVCVVSGAGATTAVGYIDGVASAAVPITNVAVAGGTGVTILTNIVVANTRFSATPITADMAAKIYLEELPLFQPNAQCTIDGTSPAVTALAYDDTTDMLQVGTSWGRSAFKNLLRVESEATTTGALTSLSANQGAILTGGTSGKFYQPAMLLRDELRRKDEARKALGKLPVFFDFDAVTSQVAFVLPKGYTTKAVYSAGTLKRNGATKDYTVGTDGFQETVTFAVAPGNTVWVSIMATRNY